MNLRLGLIGDNIAASRMPKLIRLSGEMCGIDVSYDLLVPKEQGLDFDGLFARCEREGFRGLNITLPYKIRVLPKLDVADPTLRRVGSANTVVFGTGQPLGFNTDFTGFIAAWQNHFGGAAPGIVAVAGAGGVGRAVSFALMELGATEVRLYDGRREMCEALAADIRSQNTLVCNTIDEALSGSDGVVNCTPLGMFGYRGSAIPAGLLPGRRWAFDAVYTPMETEFLLASRAAGLAIMGGYELHFYQGILAFQHFTGKMPHDLAELRRRHLVD
jgi:shikimate dehydrogenase